MTSLRGVTYLIRLEVSTWCNVTCLVTCYFNPRCNSPDDAIRGVCRRRITYVSHAAAGQDLRFVWAARTPELSLSAPQVRRRLITEDERNIDLSRRQPVLFLSFISFSSSLELMPDLFLLVLPQTPLRLERIAVH